MTNYGQPIPDTPNPGNRAALDAGCICPVMDNWRGDPELGRIRGFVVVVGCPVHDPHGTPEEWASAMADREAG